MERWSDEREGDQAGDGKRRDGEDDDNEEGCMRMM